MTNEQFSKWWGDFQNRFPDTGQWVAANGGRRLLEMWRDAFTAVDFEDALEANRLMFIGADEKPKAYEREETPAFLLAITGRLNRSRYEETERVRLRQVGNGGGQADGFPAGKMFAIIWASTLPKGETGGERRPVVGTGEGFEEGKRKALAYLDRYCAERQEANRGE